VAYPPSAQSRGRAARAESGLTPAENREAPPEIGESRTWRREARTQGGEARIESQETRTGSLEPRIEGGVAQPAGAPAPPEAADCGRGVPGAAEKRPHPPAGREPGRGKAQRRAGPAQPFGLIE
jgi:hypothetical protein